MNKNLSLIVGDRRFLLSDISEMIESSLLKANDEVLFELQKVIALEFVKRGICKGLHSPKEAASVGKSGWMASPYRKTEAEIMFHNFMVAYKKKDENHFKAITLLDVYQNFKDCNNEEPSYEFIDLARAMVQGSNSKRFALGLFSSYKVNIDFFVSLNEELPIDEQPFIPNTACLHYIDNVFATKFPDKKQLEE